VIGKTENRVLKRERKRRELYAKKEKRSGTLRHLQTTIALRGIIQLNLMLFGKRKSKRIQKGELKQRA